MRPPTTSASEPPWLEMALRVCLVATYALIVTVYASAFARDPSRWTLLLLLFAEGLSLVLVVLARRAIVRDASPLVIATTVFAVLPAVLMSPAGVVQLVPEGVGVVVQLAGLGVQVAAKVSLGRSFAALPSRRGDVVTRGPYRHVRHPMYLGYAIGDLGFLLVNFSVRNALVLAVLAGCQVYRIRREERLLALASDYRDYSAQVRWRVIPGVW